MKNQKPKTDALTAPTAVGSGALLGIVNALFGTKCKNLDCVDVSNLWSAIIAKTKPRYANVLYLKYEKQMTYDEIGNNLGVSRGRAHQMGQKALRIVRRKCCSAIIGWWNLTRDA